MRVRLHNGYTRAYAQIMQHTHTHKAVTGRVEAKSYSLVEGTQTIVHHTQPQKHINRALFSLLSNLRAYCILGYQKTSEIREKLKVAILTC